MAHWLLWPWALQHMKAGDIEKKGLAISKAIMIIDSGLRASLDKKVGGEIAENLDALYAYMSQRLMMANLKNQPEILEEVHSLLKDLKSAWDAIGPAHKLPRQPSICPLMMHWHRVYPVSSVPEMMSSQDIITLYEAMSAITGEMLTAARDKDWELLITLESRCAAHVQTLQEKEPVALLSGLELEQKVHIIQKILADDRQIRTLAEPWMAQLSALMNSANTERKLSQAYGS